jgi:Cytochrome P460
VRTTYLLIAILCLSSHGCTSRRTGAAELVNHKASLRGGLPFNPLQWRVISSSVDTRDSTVSVLYGNDIAVRHARTDARRPYPAGSVISLVTWAQEEDPHWFGAKTPGEVKSVEFVTAEESPGLTPAYSYQIFEGAALERTAAEDVSNPDLRISDLLGRRALVMP